MSEIKIYNPYDRPSNDLLLSIGKRRFKDKSPGDAWVDDDYLWEKLARKGLIFEIFSEKEFLESRMPLPWNLMSDRVLITYISRNYSGISSAKLNNTHPHIYRIASERGIIPELIERKVFVEDLATHNKKKIKSVEEFKELIKNDAPIRNLAAAALMLNGDSGGFESAILEIYSERFKNQSQLHQYLEESRDNIIELVGKGITNLGVFIGEFSLANRSILPVLLGEAFNGIENGKFLGSLEKKLVRSLQTVYSPRFNKDRNDVMTEIESKINTSNGKVQAIYLGLKNHYQEVIKLEEKLK